MCRNFSDLPMGLRETIKSVIGGEVDLWVHRPIPALNNRSVIELMSSAEGEREVRIYLQRVESDSR
jgi:hypothetical protein